MIRLFEQIDCILLLHIKGDTSREKNLKQLTSEIGSIKEIVTIKATTPTSNNFSDLLSKIKIPSFPVCFRCGKTSCDDHDCNNILIPPQIACFFTHKEALQTVIRKEYKTALILEDDVFLHDYVYKIAVSGDSDNLVVSELKRDVPTLVKLGWALSKQHQFKPELNLIENDNITMANPAYALNHQAAKKILQHLDKNGLSHTADMMIHYDHIQGLKRVRVDPPLFSEKSWSTGEINSSIHPKDKYLDQLRDQLKFAANDEGKSKQIRESIDAHSLRTIRQQKHCLYIASFFVKAEEVIELALAPPSAIKQKNIDERFICENIFDPLVQTFFFKIKPVFIEELIIELPRDKNSVILFERHLFELMERVKPFIEKTGIGMLPNYKEPILRAVAKMSNSRITYVYKQEHQQNLLSIDARTESVLSELKRISLLNDRPEYLDTENLYKRSFSKKISLYSTYRYYQFFDKHARCALYFPKRPKVSIITVTLDADDIISATINSIMSQRNVDYELILIDGDIYAKTAHVARSSAVKINNPSCIDLLLLVGKDNGIYDAMNKGVMVARGEYIIFMNAGDKFCEPESLSKLLNGVNSEDFIYGDTVAKYGAKSQVIESNSEVSFLPFGNIFSHQSVLIKASTHRTLLYDLSYRLVADHNFFLKAYLSGKQFKQVKIPVAEVDPTGVSSDPVDRTLERWVSVRRVFKKKGIGKEEVALIDRFYSSLAAENKIKGGVDYYLEHKDSYQKIVEIVRDLAK